MNHVRKMIISTFVGLSFFAAFSATAHESHGNHQAGALQSTADGGWADGIVKKVDKAAGKVTVAHGPLSNLNMPAMTMVFRVKDAAWIDRMQTGGKIRFVAEVVNGTYTIVQLEP
ncbi:MAG: copper-binding protein [Betaproteobacteria bacterium]